ncbi:SH3 domain-containing protein, partial [Clostridium cadaveris]|nr:SH3 domain-containing protein [Clostridium cadaveris]
MPAVIVEPFFIEATEDVAIYRRVGGEGIANAIVEGITGEKVNTPEESPQEPSNYDYSVKDKIGTVTASALNVRDGAGTEYKIIGQLVKGKKVRIGFALGDWYNVYFGDHGGWVHKNYLNLENQYGIVTAKSGLKVRDGAGTGYRQLGVLSCG